MTYDYWFWSSLLVLLGLVGTSINNARLAKIGVKLNLANAVLPTALFAAFHTCWWMGSANSPSPVAEWIIFYVVGCLASVAFLCGTAFLTTNFLKLSDTALCINKEHIVYKLLHGKLGIDLDGKSLCSMSWLSAVILFIGPALYLIIAVLGFSATLVICFVTFQNPITYWLEVMELQGWPETKIARNKKGWIISPTPYLLGLALIASVAYLLIMTSNGLFVLSTVLLACVGGFVAWLVFYVVSLVMELRYNPTVQEKVDEDVEDAFDTLSDLETWKRSFYIFIVFWQIFRQKFCPKIKSCDAISWEQELRTSGCSDDYDN